MKTFEEILREASIIEHDKSGIDDDYTNLHAIWTASELLIKQGDKTQCLKFIQYVLIWWGEYKACEVKGDMIDAGILNNNDP